MKIGTFILNTDNEIVQNGTEDEGEKTQKTLDELPSDSRQAELPSQSIQTDRNKGKINREWQ